MHGARKLASLAPGVPRQMELEVTRAFLRSCLIRDEENSEHVLLGVSWTHYLELVVTLTASLDFQTVLVVGHATNLRRLQLLVIAMRRGFAGNNFHAGASVNIEIVPSCASHLQGRVEGFVR